MAKTNRDTRILFFMLIRLTIIYSLPALISVVLDIYKGGFAQPNRNLPMFWSTEPINATGMASFFIFNMCIPALVLVSYKTIPKSFILIFIDL